MPSTVTIETTPRHVDAGEEAFFCQNIANPFGQDVDVVQSESFMSAGSHHLFVFYEPKNADGPLEDCSGLEFKSAVHAAQSPQHSITYPEGVGRFVSASDGLRVMAHYLNTTNDPIEAKISVVFHVVPAGSVEFQAAAVFFNNSDISVPALSTGEATKTCALPYEIQLIDAVSHMHQHATNFQAKTDTGTMLYEGTDWDSPEALRFDPPLVLPAGTQITFTCNYDNTKGSEPLSFGESAKTNEMCIFGGRISPRPWARASCVSESAPRDGYPVDFALKLMRFRSRSTPSTRTRIRSPTATTSFGSFTKRSARAEM